MTLDRALHLLRARLGELQLVSRHPADCYSVYEKGNAAAVADEMRFIRSVLDEWKADQMKQSFSEG